MRLRLGEPGLDPRPIRFIQMLHAHLHTGIFHNGIRHPGFRSDFGIKQRCPLSGSLFLAIAEDPLSRAHLARFVVHRGRIHLFADDAAVALFHLESAGRGIMDIFRNWALALGLSLKLRKCSIIMAGRGKERYEQFCASHLAASHVSPVSAATYLGVGIGPGAHL